MNGSGESVAGPQLAKVAGAAFVLFVTLLAATRVAGVPATYALADTARFSNSRFIGIVTGVGLLFWASALTACVLPLFTTDVPAAERAFLWASGGVTLMLLVDDSLLLHEAVGELAGPDAGSAGSVLEWTVYLLFLIVFVVYARHFWDRLFAAGGRAYLAAALLLFAASTAFDFQEIVHDLGESSSAGTLVVMAEEGLEFAGILFWVVFYWTVAREDINSFRAASAPHEPAPRAVSEPTHDPGGAGRHRSAPKTSTGSWRVR